MKKSGPGKRIGWSSPAYRVVTSGRNTHDNVKYLELRIGHVRLQNSLNRDFFDYPREMSKLRLTFYTTILKFVRAYAKYINDHPYLEKVPLAGLVLHFNKRYHNDNKCWESYLRVQDDSLIRYKVFQEECFMNLLIFQNIRNQLPYAEDYLIGIDGASNELLMEPWVLAPVFRSVKDRYSYILKNKHKEIFGFELTSRKDLGITFHVGEVFRSVISGLRHVDEVIEYFGFQSGERIGHGTVLGISIDEYLYHHPDIYIPAIELLDNLLWLYHLKSKGNLFGSISSSFFEEEISKVVHFIYDNEHGHLDGQISLHHLYMAYRKQFEELSSVIDIREDYQRNHQRKTENCFFSTTNNWDENILFLTRHCRCYLEKMVRFIKVEISHELVKKIYSEAQEYMLKKVSHKGIIVETNPVSNLNIGEIYGMKKHPIFELNNVYKEGNNKIMVSINTDNPGVFSTTLQNQFGFIQQMLYDMNIPMEDALRWIDVARENGIYSAFMNNVSKTKEQILDELKQVELFIKKEIGLN